MKRISLLSFVAGFIACAIVILLGVVWIGHVYRSVPGILPPTTISTSTAALPALPTVVGQCSTATVAEVTQRLEDGVTGQAVPDSGSQIIYTNGGRQVSYDTVQGIEDSRAGDGVLLCLKSIPTDCPPGDDRGKVYAATNLRTGETWKVGDSEHECGGA